MNRKLFIGGEIDLGPKGKKRLDPLRISREEYAMAQQGHYPVILLNLKSVKGRNYQGIEKWTKINIKSLYREHNYLKNSDRISPEEKKDFRAYLQGKIDAADLEVSLQFLSELLFKHFGQKVYILIDEYDAPITNSYLKFSKRLEEFEEVLDLFRGILGAALKSNPYLEKGMMTGIFRIAKANLFSDLNNVQEYTLLDEKFTQFYGFTQEEVDELLKKVPTDTAPQAIKDWYNGYTLGGEVLYNPWSIMSCLSRGGKLDNYWVDSGKPGLLDQVFFSDKLQEDLQQLVSRKHLLSPILKQISWNEIDQPVGFFSLLLFSGYLNPVAKGPGEDLYELAIPNQEVKKIYGTRILDWVSKQLKIDRRGYYDLVLLLPAGKLKEFKNKLEKLLLKVASFYQTGQNTAEVFYSGFMLGFAITLDQLYHIESERESGMGRPDLVLIPKEGSTHPAFIIEYKICAHEKDLASTAKEGLDQIIDLHYDTQVKRHRHVQKIIKMALVFCGKKVELQYQEDQVSNVQQ